MTWREAVLTAIYRYAERHETKLFDRQALINEELSHIVADVGSTGATPHQTLSRILQELRDDGTIEFLASGVYLLLDRMIDAASEDYQDEALDVALRANRLQLGVVATDSVMGQQRLRRGQQRLRHLTLRNYDHQCAVCDIADPPLLIASHILGWSEGPEHRGDLRNVLCLCRLHDALFEHGYWSLTDDFHILRRRVSSAMISLVLSETHGFRLPTGYHPDTRFLEHHRTRSGFVAA